MRRARLPSDLSLSRHAPLTRTAWDFSKDVIRGNTTRGGRHPRTREAAVCWFAGAWLAVAATLATADRAGADYGGPLHRGEWHAAARLVAWHVRALRAATWLAVPGAVTRLPQALASQAEAEEGLGHIERAGRLLDEATARVRDLEPDDGTARGLRWRHDVFHREHAGQAS